MQSRIRALDYFHTSSLNSDNATARAADEIIDHPDKHLLTQDDLFWAEGGIIGLAAQVGGVAGGIALLFSYHPALRTYLFRGQMKPYDWICLGGTAFTGFKVGQWGGMAIFGDRQKVKNHWMAYTYVKACNRFEGR